MTVNSEKITYLYDVNDNRMYKNVDTTLEEYYLKDLGVLNMKTGDWTYYASGTERFLRIELDSVHQPKYNASIDSISISNGERFFYETDHLGNTRIVFTPRDVYFKYIHFASDFYPYGKILREYVVGNQERYLTTQHERDQETGLDYRGARFFDSDIARFEAIDALQSKYPGFSVYAYCLGNPVKFTDPTGNAPEGIYKDILTGEVLGSDGVDDKKEYTISKEDYYKVAPMSAHRKEELTAMAATREIPTLNNSPVPYEFKPKTIMFNPEQNKSESNSHMSTAITISEGLASDGAEIFIPIVIAWAYYQDKYGSMGDPRSWVETQPDPTVFPYVPGLKGFDPNKLNGGQPPNNMVKWALGVIGAYKIYKNYQTTMTRNGVNYIPAVAPIDKTYVAPPTIYPTVVNN